MQVRCFYFRLIFLNILVNEDGEDRWVTGDVGDELRIIDQSAISGSTILLSHGRLREGRLKRSQEVRIIFVLKLEAYRREYQSESAVVLLGELGGILFDSAERLDGVLLAQVDERLDLDDAERVLVLELLLDSFSIFLG